MEAKSNRIKFNKDKYKHPELKTVTKWPNICAKDKGLKKQIYFNETNSVI